MVLNLLMLTPTIYMLQLYDRVLSSRSQSTLLMLTLIVTAIYLTQGALEWVRSQLLVRVSARLETLLNKRLYKVAYKQSLYSGGQRASSQPLDDFLYRGHVYVPSVIRLDSGCFYHHPVNSGGD